MQSRTEGKGAAFDTCTYIYNIVWLTFNKNLS